MLRYKRPKQRSRRWFEDELDRLFSFIVRSRGACERCGSEQELQCAHVVGRDDQYLRWDFENALCLCNYCHNVWAHPHPQSFKDWFAQKFPDRQMYLDSCAGAVMKRPTYEIEALYETLKQQADDLRNRQEWL